MKLAAFGAIVGVVGLVIGVDGLVYSGALWFVTGLLIKLVARRGGSGFPIDGLQEAEVGRIEGAQSRAVSFGAAGIVFVLIAGLGSIAIGALNMGFSGDHEFLRWFPFAIGLLITLIGLVSIPVEMGAIKADPPSEPESVVEGGQKPGTGSPVVGEGKGSPEDRLAKVESLHQRGLISAEEYEAQRDRILGSI